MQAFTTVRWVTVLGTAATLLLGVLALAWLFQRRMIYLPLDRHVPPPGSMLPGAEAVSFPTPDGLLLNGWFLPAGPPASGETVLVFNGNAGNRSYRADLAAALSERGFGVLLFDYRGYADNPGRPSEAGLGADARGALAYLESRHDVDSGRIVYFGESLGSGVAVELAVAHPPLALILRSPFTSLTDVARLHYPFLPIRLLLVDRYPSIDRISRSNCPLLIIAGDRDRIVPEKLSRTLYEAAPVRDKRYLLVEGADHNAAELLAGGRMIGEVSSFLASTRTGSPPIRPD